MEDENKKLKTQLAELQRILLATQKKLAEHKKPTNEDRQLFLQVESERKLRIEYETKLKEVQDNLESKERKLIDVEKQLAEERVSVELGSITIDGFQKKLQEQNTPRESNTNNDVTTNDNCNVDLDAAKVDLVATKIELIKYQEIANSERGQVLHFESKLSLTEKQLNALRNSASADAVRHVTEVNEMKAHIATLGQDKIELEQKIEVYEKSLQAECKKYEELLIRNTSITAELAEINATHINTLKNIDLINSQHNEQNSQKDYEILLLESKVSNIANLECDDCVEWENKLQNLEQTKKSLEVELQQLLAEINKISETKALGDKDKEDQYLLIIEENKEVKRVNRILENEIAATKELLLVEKNKQSEAEIVIGRHAQLLLDTKQMKIECEHLESDNVRAKQMIEELAARDAQSTKKESALNTQIEHIVSTNKIEVMQLREELKAVHEELGAVKVFAEDEKQNNLKLLENIKEDRLQLQTLKEQHLILTKLCEESQNTTEFLQIKSQEEKKTILKELELLKDQHSIERSSFAQKLKSMQQDRLALELSVVEQLKDQIVQLRKVVNIQSQLAIIN